MKNDEFNYYNKIKNWDFSQINCEVEVFTNWDINKILNERATINSRILDLGTGGGEIVINEFPEALEIVGTDFSPEMIKTAKENLKKSKKKNIKFRIMDNLNNEKNKDILNKFLEDINIEILHQYKSQIKR